MAISDSALKIRLDQLAARLTAYRLSLNLTQRQVAEDAAVSLNALRRLEDGQNVSLDTLVRVLESLNLGDRLEALAPPAQVRPVDRVRLATRAERKRARPPKSKPAAPWTWGDDT